MGPGESRASPARQGVRDAAGDLCTLHAALCDAQAVRQSVSQAVSQGPQHFSQRGIRIVKRGGTLQSWEWAGRRWPGCTKFRVVDPFRTAGALHKKEKKGSENWREKKKEMDRNETDIRQCDNVETIRNI